MAAFRYLFSALLVLSSLGLEAQTHTPLKFNSGFDPAESDDMLKLNQIFDSVPAPWFDEFIPGYRFVYRSPEIGLDNSWDLWMRSDHTAVILIRATTSDPKSILADFLCTMSPANGSFKLTDGSQITYKLAEHPKAAVHTGFLLCFGYLANDMKPKIDSLYHMGVRNFIVTGHSQGAALSYLVSSWLSYQKKDNIYPDIQLKTYASAPPKPGNPTYAHDFNNIMGYDRAFSLVNSEDPIPEIPYTTQQTDEVNTPNPLTMLEASIKKLSFLKRTVLTSRINKMKKNARASSKSYQKYLGHDIAGMMKQLIPGIEIPETVNTTNFVTPGTPISLLLREAFKTEVQKEMEANALSQHSPETYRILLRQYGEL